MVKPGTKRKAHDEVVKNEYGCGYKKTELTLKAFEKLYSKQEGADIRDAGVRALAPYDPGATSGANIKSLFDAVVKQQAKLVANFATNSEAGTQPFDHKGLSRLPTVLIEKLATGKGVLEDGEAVYTGSENPKLRTLTHALVKWIVPEDEEDDSGDDEEEEAPEGAAFFADMPVLAALLEPYALNVLNVTKTETADTINTEKSDKLRHVVMHVIRKLGVNDHAQMKDDPINAILIEAENAAMATLSGAGETTDSVRVKATSYRDFDAALRKLVKFKENSAGDTQRVSTQDLLLGQKIVSAAVGPTRALGSVTPFLAAELLTDTGSNALTRREVEEVLAAAGKIMDGSAYTDMGLEPPDQDVRTQNVLMMMLGEPINLQVPVLDESNEQKKTAAGFGVTTIQSMRVPVMGRLMNLFVRSSLTGRTWPQFQSLGNLDVQLKAKLAADLVEGSMLSQTSRIVLDTAGRLLHRVTYGSHPDKLEGAGVFDQLNLAALAAAYYEGFAYKDSMIEATEAALNRSINKGGVDLNGTKVMPPFGYDAVTLQVVISLFGGVLQKLAGGYDLLKEIQRTLSYFEKYKYPDGIDAFHRTIAESLYVVQSATEQQRLGATGGFPTLAFTGPNIADSSPSLVFSSLDNVVPLATRTEMTKMVNAAPLAFHAMVEVQKQTPTKQKRTIIESTGTDQDLGNKPRSAMTPEEKSADNKRRKTKGRERKAAAAAAAAAAAGAAVGAECVQALAACGRLPSSTRGLCRTPWSSVARLSAGCGRILRSSTRLLSLGFSQALTGSAVMRAG